VSAWLFSGDAAVCCTGICSDEEGDEQRLPYCSKSGTSAATTATSTTTTAATTTREVEEPRGHGWWFRCYHVGDTLTRSCRFALFLYIPL